MLKPSLISVAILSVLSTSAFAKDKTEQEQKFEQITVIGSKKAVDTVPGSATYVGEQELEAFKFSDISRVLSSVPGVYVQEEDGYGLRPNIGMRGTGTGRNDKVAIMEDGVLAAPAPYAAPSAYYFPTMGRMQAIEVLKGSSAVKYGPRTTGGVLNLISRSIPTNELSGAIDLAYGSDAFNKVHAYVGGNKDNISGLVEAYHYGADGFKDLPNDQNTGFSKNDILTKIGVEFGQDNKQYLELKIKYSDEVSDETYMGLTDQDYEATPLRRYAASQKDEMSTRHNAYQVNYGLEVTADIEFMATAYVNDFHRNWYKASDVKSADLAQYSAFELNPTAEGLTDIGVKANNRDYLSSGLQTELHISADEHYLTFGARYHEDEMDRFQWKDKYTLNQDLSMTLTSAGVPGTDSNRVDSANALTLFAHDEWSIGKLVLSGGIRFEDIEINRLDWGKNNVERQGEANKDISNHSQIVSPAIGMTYNASERVVWLAGIQKGYAPAAPGNAEQQEEESLNFEAGVRVNLNDMSGEFIFFNSDYDNMHGNCTAAIGCNEENIGDQYNYGEVQVTGFEFIAAKTIATPHFDVPVRLTYTYTNSEFQSDFESELWGEVTKGDAMPYIPENQLALVLGVENDRFSANAQVRYVSSTHANLTDEGLDAIDGRSILDLALKYHIDKQQDIYLTLDNVMDEVYIANRANGGIQPGKPRSFNLGYQFKF